ncbi:MAG: ATP-dependent helicase [Lewinellaceae bacterium]|nr:ATP-dependent helicase [Lewinellaceae bacterium]
MSDLQARNDAFRAFLDTLNAAQRRAVEQTEGPVLVVAGPGTGKTHVLTARIGKILLDTDARSQNVLCLTFTDAGAHAMRQRLLERIGPEAHRVAISTFHSFCNRIIQEHLEYFGRGGLEPVTDLERIGIVRQLLSKLPPEHLLREGKKDVYRYETELRDLFATMKKEGWSPGFVLRRTDEFLSGLPQNPDFIYQKNTRHGAKGSPKTALVQEVTEKLERLKAAADLYPKYLSAMTRAGRYEYEDMLLWVIAAFGKNEALLRIYQERYQYILVDEFQDTNGAQFQLLNLLLDFWDTPNIFIVGDDDQSIFEFQGARLENLRAFGEKYRQGLELVVLQENYRSAQDILDAAGLMIRNNTLRALHLFEDAGGKQLEAAKALQGMPQWTVYENRLHEVADVVLQIGALLQAGAEPDEIAVIYARHRQASRLMSLLEKKGIPYQTKRPVDILELPLIRQFRELLTYLHEESQAPFSGEHRLFRLLHAAFFNLRPLDLARIALSLRSEGEAANARRYATPGERTLHLQHWRAILADRNALTDAGIADPEPYLRLSGRLENWIAGVHNLPLPHLIEQLYSQSGLLQWTLGQSDKIWLLQVLHTFTGFVLTETERSAHHFKQVGDGLTHLLGQLDSMDDNRLPLPLRQAVEISTGVQLLTAHAAKGLEFEHVFVIDGVDDMWEKNAGGARGRFALPPTLTLSGEEDAGEARRRLFYVAMTRAKSHLYLSCARHSDDGKPLTHSRFLDETGLPPIEASIAPSLIAEAQALLLLEPERPVVALPEPALLDAWLERYSLSISGLNRYLRCPLSFYYEDVLQVPGAVSEAAAFGIAMHGALQQFTLKMKADKKQQWPSAETLMRIFVHEMERQQGYFSAQNYAQRLALGKDYLRRIHVEQVPFWRRRAIVERRIDRVELEGAPLTGVIDKIEWLDNGSIRIVDYKTGAPDPKKTAPPDEQQTHGGEYWRQLAFYRILLERARLYPEPVGKTAVSWLEPDKRGAFPIQEVVFSAADIQGMEQLIRDVYAGIRERAFDRGCGKDDCPWCRMHRDRELPETMERGVEEGLDDR